MIRTPLKRMAKRAAKVAFAAGDIPLGRIAGPRILIYHQVGGGSGLEMEVAPGSFARQLEWIARHGQVVDLDIAMGLAGTPEGDHSYVLTFDDGYRSLHDVAFPLLQSLGFPFLLYLTTDPVESGRPLRDYGGGVPLAWSQVEAMLSSGLLTVGAHTHTHPDLRSTSEAQVEAELDMSDGLIRERLDVDPVHFAYPWGYWAATADRVVRRRYRTAALGAGAFVGSEPDPFLLHRLPVQLTDGFHLFRARMWGGLRTEERLRRRLRGYDGP